MKKNLEVKQKIINHLIKNGKKRTSEKILIKSVKTLQKQSVKQIKKTLQITIKNSLPIFRLHTVKKPKKIPAFISHKPQRISTAIKFILQEAKKKRTGTFYESLKQEIIFVSKNNIIEQKTNLQKQAILNKRYLKYFRWN